MDEVVKSFLVSVLLGPPNLPPFSPPLDVRNLLPRNSVPIFSVASAACNLLARNQPSTAFSRVVSLFRLSSLRVGFYHSFYNSPFPCLGSVTLLTCVRISTL